MAWDVCPLQAEPVATALVVLGLVGLGSGVLALARPAGRLALIAHTVARADAIAIFGNRANCVSSGFRG